jgi:hypothetical protein
VKRHALLGVVLVVVLSGCKVDTAVTIDMRDNGSGVVSVRATLDAEAVREAEAGGGKLKDRVRLGDLETAGWTVSPWARSGAGTAQIELTKAFSSPEQVAEIVNEVSGSNGPLRDVRADRARSLASTRSSLTGAIDLSAIQTGVIADQELVNALANQQVDVNAIDQALLTELRNSVSVRVVVKLPDGSTTTINGIAGQRVPFDVSASNLDTRRLALLGLAVLLAVLAIVVLLTGRRRRFARGPIRRFEVHARASDPRR